MRIAVCEDDAMECGQFMDALRGWDPTRSAEVFSDGASLLQAAKVSPPFSIAFLDIYLPKENGMDVAATLREISPETELVFVTTSREHAVEAYSLSALHYLVKPVTTEGIREAFRRLAHQNIRQRSILTLAVGRSSHTVYQDEIVCLQSVNHAVEISLTDGRTLKVWTPLNELEKKLNETFLKINRGTLVNMEHIEQLGFHVCILRNGTRLSVSGRESAPARTAYSDFLFSRLSERTWPEQGVGPWAWISFCATRPVF